MEVDRSGFEVLSRDDCVSLLATARVGRIGFHSGALPVVLPVAFALDGDSVVVRVRPGSQLADATRRAVVAFEIDDVDRAAGRAWSVTVTGMATAITDAAELAQAGALPMDEWAGTGDRFVRISLDLVSGRRARPVPAATAPPAEGAAVTGPAAVAETHTGTVFFVGDRAYKLKKPVALGFLDFTTRHARLAACRREVELNRRLAPDVYLGVADVWGPDGSLCDHLVVMRRMPADRRLSSLVLAGAPVDAHLGALAALLARFHERAARSPAIDRAATADADARRWEANAREMGPFLGRVLDAATSEEVLALARRYLDGRQPLFQRRIAAGRACDGHGDLLADDIFCLDDGPRVLDCLEFDDRLRHGDVLADVAFLAMDLERLGRPDLAASFLEAYRQASGDSWPPSLADHYVAYRAQVRAKVACVRWEQGDEASAEEAERLLDLCRDRLLRARVRLVLVGGGPGTGKSTLARGIAAELGALVVRSDEVRKELAGLDPLAPAPTAVGQGLYAPALTDATYAQLLARARVPLTSGRTVVLDATWRDAHWRRAAASLAAATAADLVELECAVALETAIERVNRRRLAGGDPSDATADVARAMALCEAPWPEATRVDTSGEPAAALAAALAVVTGEGRKTR